MNKTISNSWVGLAFGASGAAALIYEVVWTRALSLVLSSTVFALSIMLATFMAGLAIGGWIGGRISDRLEGRTLLAAFGIAEFSIAITGLLSLVMIFKAVPPLYMKIFHALHEVQALYYAAVILLCGMVMIAPTVLMGCTFPLVSKHFASNSASFGRSVGNAYAFNTFGAIIGSLLAGFFLVPVFGLKEAVIAAAALNTIAAVGMTFYGGHYGRLAAAMAGAVVLTAALVWAADARAREINPTSAGRYESYAQFAEHTSREKALFERNDIEGRVILLRAAGGHHVLQVGNRIESSSTDYDRAPARISALLPSAYRPDAKSMLIIGLGTSMTLDAALGRNLWAEVVEINRSVVDAVRYHLAPELLDGAGIIIDDARHYLTTTRNRYDIITSAPSYPTTQGVSNLYTLEFYRMAKGRLNEGGVFCQWMPYYFMSDDDVTMMLRTFSAAFRNVTLWKITDSMNLFMVGSDGPLEKTVSEIFNAIGTDYDWLYDLVQSRTPEQALEIAERAKHIPLNTDNLPLLEFNTAANVIMGL